LRQNDLQNCFHTAKTHFGHRQPLRINANKPCQLQFG
jgi:hypothetical protein